MIDTKMQMVNVGQRSFSFHRFTVKLKFYLFFHQMESQLMERGTRVGIEDTL